MKTTKLTPQQKKAMEKYAKKWIDIGLKTGETDWDTFDKYFPICYKKAGLEYPKNVIRVQSPLVGALASATVEAILKKNGKGGAVNGAVGDTVYDAVGVAVRDAVGDAVGVAVRDAVHDAVGDTVYDAVDDAVHGAVGVAVRDAVGDTKLSWHYWLGGQFWVGGWYYWGVAFVNFFFDVCKLKLSKDTMERAEAYRKVCESVNYIWPNKNFVMVCARPTKIELEEVPNSKQRRLHSTTGKAIEYPDGWGLYMLHGVRFEKEWWEKIVNDQFTAEEVFAIDNLEHRRIAYEYMDKSKMKALKDYKILDEATDEQGNQMKIISFQVKNVNEPLKYLNVICPTTGREYYLGTDKNECFEAKYASFGLYTLNHFNQEK